MTISLNPVATLTPPLSARPIACVYNFTALSIGTLSTYEGIRSIKYLNPIIGTSKSIATFYFFIFVGAIYDFAHRKLGAMTSFNKSTYTYSAKKVTLLASMLATLSLLPLLQYEESKNPQFKKQGPSLFTVLSCYLLYNMLFHATAKINQLHINWTGKDDLANEKIARELRETAEASLLLCQPIE